MLLEYKQDFTQSGEMGGTQEKTVIELWPKGQISNSHTKLNSREAF